jgi:hypothetical protein
MIAAATADGRTDLRCLQCDKVDPLKTEAAKWALASSHEGGLKTISLSPEPDTVDIVVPSIS